MKRLKIADITDRYRIRELTDDDVPEIFSLCAGNPLFYEYCGHANTPELIRGDMVNTPGGKTADDKYYAGFFKDGELIAVMDLIDGYPDAETAFLGFFMMRNTQQGSGEGSRIVQEIFAFLKRQKFRSVRLCINEGNPQSYHFWMKNGFTVLRKAHNGSGTVYLAEKTLQE